MTKNMELDPEEENSRSSHGSNSASEFLIGDTIIEEEERLTIESEKIVNEEDRQFSYLKEAKENIETNEDLVRKREAEIREKRYKRLIHLLNNSKIYAVLLKNRIQGEVTASFNYQKTEENVVKEDGKNSAAEVFDTEFFKKTRITDLGFTVSYKQPLLLEGGVMRDYQLRGLEWMTNLFLNGVNGILADEMGLGKTIQVIAFICYLIQQDIKGPFLIVAPLSTLTNWMVEFKKFAPKVPTMLYHGPEEERKALLPKILEVSEVGKKSAHKVVITSYQIPLRDNAILTKINWYYLIIDEGHRIKNYNSVLSRKLRPVNTIGRLLLTGTPLQNSLCELWSLLNFLLPEVFSSLEVFESWFDIKELEKNGTRFMQEKFNIDVINVLQEILMPFVLRREKKDIDLQLPPKKEILIYCRMTQRQKELYEATLDRSIEYLLKSREDVIDIKEPLPKRWCFLNSPYGREDGSQQSKRARVKSPSRDEARFVTNIVLRNPQMQLRKIVNHPYLVQFPLLAGTEELRIDEDLVKESGKLLVLDAMLARLKSRGHKVLIFSFFKIMLDILADYATMRNYSYCRLDGSSGIADRDEEITKFSSDPDIFIFLISIRAGGLGINLTAADTVIFYDSDWNPQVNLQAQDRCHRIGQTKPVVVYRLCTIRTIDEKIVERGSAKRRLEKMILQKGKYTLISKTSQKLNLLDLQELKKLLESPDHDTVIHSNGFVLADEELEALMDRSGPVQ